jgi:hypothetical protein
MNFDPVHLTRNREHLNTSYCQRRGPGCPGAIAAIGAIDGQGNLDVAGNGHAFIPPGK